MEQEEKDCTERNFVRVLFVQLCSRYTRVGWNVQQQMRQQNKLRGKALVMDRKEFFVEYLLFFFLFYFELKLIRI